jgi:hypothetical protein
MGACGVIDNACIINERFEQPWQSLNGISLKNISVPESSYPTTTKAYKFKWAALENRSYLGEFEAEFKKALAVNQGPRVYCFEGKNRRSNIS